MMDYILNIQMTARETADAIDRLQTREDISFFYKRALPIHRNRIRKYDRMLLDAMARDFGVDKNEVDRWGINTLGTLEKHLFDEKNREGPEFEVTMQYEGKEGAEIVELGFKRAWSYARDLLGGKVRYPVISIRQIQEPEEDKAYSFEIRKPHNLGSELREGTVDEWLEVEKFQEKLAELVKWSVA